MHFEILIEDQSSAKAMEILMPKLIVNEHTIEIHSYKGLGRIPKGLKPNSDASKRQLLTQLPRLLQGYGNVPGSGTIVVVCDLDNNDKTQFLSELQQVLENCSPKPDALFVLAIEEIEAWYLGDLNAIHKAYPNAKTNVLSRYINDSICGTWELLADAICKGGYKELKKKGWQSIGKQKSIWANDICPHMNVNQNSSPSFNDMYTKLRAVTS